MPPVHLEKVLRHAERELVHQSHLRPTDLLDIYRRFLKLEEHRLKLEHKHGEGGRDLCKKRADVISVMLRHLWNGAWETHLRSHMDKPPRIALLAELKTRCTIFVIEHTMKVIRELADRVVVLLAGEKIADGPPRDILADKRVVENYLGSVDA